MAVIQRKTGVTSTVTVNTAVVNVVISDASPTYTTTSQAEIDVLLSYPTLELQGAGGSVTAPPRRQVVRQNLDTGNLENEDGTALAFVKTSDLAPAIAADPAVQTAAQTAAAAAVGTSGVKQQTVKSALAVQNQTPRTNLCTNPGLYTGTTGWNSYAGSGGTATVTNRVQNAAGRYRQRMTWTASPASVSGGGIYARGSADDIPVVAGTTVMPSMTALPSINQRMRTETKFYNSSGTQVGGSTYGASQVIPAGTEVRLYGPTGGIVVPATATRLQIVASAVAGGSDTPAQSQPWPVGSTLDFGDAMCETGTAMAAYFDGGMDNAWWTGTANASTSQGGVVDVSGLAPKVGAQLTNPTINGGTPVVQSDIANVVKWDDSQQLVLGSAMTKGDGKYYNGIDVRALANGTWDATNPKVNVDAGQAKLGANRNLNPVRPPIATPAVIIRRMADSAGRRTAPQLTHLPAGFDPATVLNQSTYGTPQNFPWVNESTPLDPLQLRGAYPETATTAGGRAIMRNRVSGAASTRQPYRITVRVYSPGWGRKALIEHSPWDSNVGFNLHVDGHMCWERHERDYSPVATTLRGAVFDDLPPGYHTLTFDLQGTDFAGIRFSGDVVVTAPPAVTLPKVGYMANSWGEQAHAWGSFPVGPVSVLSRLLGRHEPYWMGRGGRGWQWPSGLASEEYIMSTERRAVATALGLDLIIIPAYQQDTGNPSGLQGSIESKCGAFYSENPNCKIALYGVEKRFGGGNSGESAVTAAAKAAAANCPNIMFRDTIADPYTEGWASSDYSIPGWGWADKALYRGDGLKAHMNEIGSSDYGAWWALSFIHRCIVAGYADGDGFDLKRVLAAAPNPSVYVAP